MGFTPPFRLAGRVFVSDVMSSCKAKTGQNFFGCEKQIPKSSWIRPLSLWRAGSLGAVFMDTGYGEDGGVGKVCVAGVGYPLISFPSAMLRINSKLSMSGWAERTHRRFAGRGFGFFTSFRMTVRGRFANRPYKSTTARSAPYPWMPAVAGMTLRQAQGKLPAPPDCFAALAMTKGRCSSE